MNIIIDSREQLPYNFQSITPTPRITIKTLKTGDYSIEGFECHIAVERKSLPDLFGSVGHDRERFEREFGRLALLDYAALVIESDFMDVFTNPPEYSRMNPKAVFRTVLAWGIKYKVQIFWGHDRKMSEKITYIILENFLKYKDNIISEKF